MFVKKFIRPLLPLLLAMVLLAGCRAPSPSPVAAPDDAARRSWLAELGWQTAATPIETLRLRLPQPLDQGWTAYAAVQEAQGLPLSRYAGQSVSRITYRVENHPAGPEAAQVNLFLCGGNIIGGDIFVLGPDGYQTNLSFPST